MRARRAFGHRGQPGSLQPPDVTPSLANSAEICTDRAVFCTVGWWGDDLPARPQL